MICEKCGALLSEEDDFCSECGVALKKSSHTLKRMQLKCKVCSGEMQLNEDQTMLVCPFCGSKELLVESDEVTIAEMQKEVELKRLENEASRLENESKRLENESQKIKNETRNKKSNKGGIIFCIIMFISMFNSGMICLGMVIELSLGAAILSFIQVIMLLMAALKMMDNIKGKKNNKHIVFAVIGYSLFVLLPIMDMNGILKLHEEYEWPSEGLATYLPQPESEYGEIWFDTERMFDVEVHETSPSDFKGYVELCKAEGFIVDAESGDYYYDAYNENGYQLRLYYYDYDDELKITIKKPMEFEEISWPNQGAGSLLPVPESLMGSELQEYEGSFSVYIGETSIEEYNAYVDACMELGFDNDYSKYEREFRATNDNGDEVTINYEGFNIMHIDIDKAHE